MKPKISVLLRTEDIDPGYVAQKVFVLLDVMGGTSVISNALELGADAIYLGRDESAAQSLAGKWDEHVGAYIPCKSLYQPNGHHEGPSLLSMPKIQGKKLAISGGSLCSASKMADGASHVYGAALLNAPAVVRQLLKHRTHSLAFVCAKPGGGMSLIDLFAAGYMIQLLESQTPDAWIHTESAKVALSVYERYQADPLACLQEGRQTKSTYREVSDATSYVTAIGIHDNVPEQLEQCVFQNAGTKYRQQSDQAGSSNTFLH